MQPITIRNNEVPEFIGVSRRSFYELQRREDFPTPITLGGSRLIIWRVADLQAWVDAQAEKTKTKKRPEPPGLAAAKAAKRAPAGAMAGETESPAAAKPRRTRAEAERSGIEPKTAGKTTREGGPK